MRGFDQRNVAVLINGVPVNDMKNGSVFWRNWNMGDVTKPLQVQRGLLASKIAVSSVGGTINVLTKGFDDKEWVLARVETGSNNYRKYSLRLSPGQPKGDWAFTVYGSRRTQGGWVDRAFDDAGTDSASAASGPRPAQPVTHGPALVLTPRPAQHFSLFRRNVLQ